MVVPFVASAEKKSAYKGAHLQLEQSECDFGELSRKSENRVLKLRFVNDGTEPLVLFAAATSCPCLKIEFSRKPVAVGEGGEIVITVETKKAERGHFRRVIQLRSNSVGGTAVVTVRGLFKD
jgi:uncharacterized protein (UPF0179 family)